MKTDIDGQRPRLSRETVDELCAMAAAFYSGQADPADDVSPATEITIPSGLLVLASRFCGISDTKSGNRDDQTWTKRGRRRVKDHLASLGFGYLPTGDNSLNLYLSLDRKQILVVSGDQDYDPDSIAELEEGVEPGNDDDAMDLARKTRIREQLDTGFRLMGSIPSEAGRLMVSDQQTMSLHRVQESDVEDATFTVVPPGLWRLTDFWNFSEDPDFIASLDWVAETPDQT